MIIIYLIATVGWKQISINLVYVPYVDAQTLNFKLKICSGIFYYM